MLQSTFALLVASPETLINKHEQALLVVRIEPVSQMRRLRDDDVVMRTKATAVALSRNVYPQKHDPAEYERLTEMVPVKSTRTRLSPKSHARLATPKTPTTRGSRPRRLEGPRGRISEPKVASDI